MSAAFTPGPWKFERGESAIELARLKGETLAEHEGYFRGNSGSWIVTFSATDTDDEGEFEVGGQICEVAFKGQAKRGEAYKAPDPEGQANARLISAAPELYEALDALLPCVGSPVPLKDTAERVRNAVAALAKARGDQ